MIRIADCPQEFIKKLPNSYPPHQGKDPMIEERAYNFFSNEKNIESDYIYIPIQWTAWHINPDGEYGQNTKPLIDFCDDLIKKHPNEKFFTIVQYDGGTLIPIDNCKIFASSGSFSSPIGKNSVYEPIPLLCNPHSGIPNEVRNNKVGYVGRPTHPIRNSMYQILKEYDGYSMHPNSVNNTNLFRSILYDSVFSLAPRGFGPASYRLYESIQMNCIPIYISDEFWLPFEDDIEWNKLCLLVNENEIHKIPKMVDEILYTRKYQEMIDYGSEMYQKYFTWEGCINKISLEVSK